MFAPLIGLALKAGIPQKYAKFAVIAVLVTLLTAGLGVAKCAYDRSVIEDHEARQEAANARADRKADTKAAEQRRADDARTTTESAEIKEAIDEAHRTGADARAAYYDCVRRLQAARRNRQPPPSC